MYTHHRYMDITKELVAVKKELADLISLHLEQQKIDPVHAQQQVTDFLNLLPIEDQQDLLIKLKKLGETYQEARMVYLNELTKINKHNREEALLQMRNAIALGNIDHAIQVAKAFTAKA